MQKLFGHLLWRGFFKVLGYLYQFGYPDAFHRISGGVLFIPGRIGREPGWTEWASGRDGNQSIATVTIPLSGLDNQNDRNECFSWVKKARIQLSGH